MKAELMVQAHVRRMAHLTHVHYLSAYHPPYAVWAAREARSYEELQTRRRAGSFAIKQSAWLCLEHCRADNHPLFVARRTRPCILHRMAQLRSRVLVGKLTEMLDVITFASEPCLVKLKNQGRCVGVVCALVPFLDDRPPGMRTESALKMSTVPWLGPVNRICEYDYDPAVVLSYIESEIREETTGEHTLFRL